MPFGVYCPSTYLSHNAWLPRMVITLWCSTSHTYLHSWIYRGCCTLSGVYTALAMLRSHFSTRSGCPPGRRLSRVAFDRNETVLSYCTLLVRATILSLSIILYSIFTATKHSFLASFHGHVYPAPGLLAAMSSILLSGPSWWLATGTVSRVTNRPGYPGQSRNRWSMSQEDSNMSWNSSWANP